MKKNLKAVAIGILLLIGYFSNASGQYTAFKGDKIADLQWVNKLITKSNEELRKLDTSQHFDPKYLFGKVLYTSDSLMRIAQLSGLYDGIETEIATTIQFKYNDKLVETNLHTIDGFDVEGSVIKDIYKLPGDKPTYLFTGKNIDYREAFSADYEHLFMNDNQVLKDYDKINSISFYATAIRLEKDSLIELKFLPNISTSDFDNPCNSYQGNEDSTQTRSLKFNTEVRHKSGSPVPYIKYNVGENTLSTLACNNDINSNEETPYVKIITNDYKYVDSAFVATADSSYSYPELKSLTQIIGNRKFKAGKYIVDDQTLLTYEDRGYDGVWPIRVENYKIGNHLITERSDDEVDRSEMLKLNYHLQADGSLILLTSGQYNAHTKWYVWLRRLLYHKFYKGY